MTSAPDQETDVALPAPVARSSVSTDIALISTFAAFIAVCAVLPGIPTPSGVPITLQTFGVILAGLVLGWRRGGLTALLYVTLGLAGLPIFAEGTGGLVVLSKPSVGYLLAFPFAAALAGAFAGAALRRTSWRYPLLVAAGLGASFLTIHPAGIAGLMARLGLSAGEALAIDVVYWPGDVVKNLAAAAVAVAVFKAFPDMLRSRR
ncbi:biotin transporter BioY [Cellulomonas fengjieae]|uniref:Biotin transporter n=1 Tax=Cellulomonas fengjieae TaxID=2819978 RepID=A0ABS3SJH5_9CELL|nr:biotin transporter BioY [Cellulomonas fengjieae]MBO3085901.1 biotin transporter BioY [Cellulomonas fengjieae]MBO3103010.1 biotin transporter BioY [Cellulomonas fengjieae]QVI67406.1 biotin transporter BioY [Cellulomonas fengjieae]